MAELETFMRGERQWECSETEGGIACNYKDGAPEDRTVLLGREGRTRIVDKDNDVELGGIE